MRRLELDELQTGRAFGHQAPR